MPLSELLLPARLGMEPKLAVTVLFIVCIMVKVDGGTRCSVRAREVQKGCDTWLQVLDLVEGFLRSRKGCLTSAVC